MPNLSAVRARARALAREHREQPRALATRAVSLVVGGQEQLGYELFRALPRAAAAVSTAQFGRLLRTLHDWGSTDCFGCFVGGVAWREGSIPDKMIVAWAGSPRRWTRRAALVSTVPLNLTARGATAPRGEAGLTLAVCARLIDDRDDMVVKAMSWALRTLAAKDRRAVEGFVKSHRERLAPRVLRETNNKLRTGLKNPRLTRSS
jgi:DNA alkylation repair enzyme